MMKRMLYVSFLVVVALLATSCTRSGTIEMSTDSGTSGGDAAAAADPAVADSSTAGGGEVADFLSPWAIETADSLVQEFGSEDAALDALFLSMDHGYSTPQIYESVLNRTLDASGFIDNVSPERESMNFILLPGEEAEGEALDFATPPEELAFVQDEKEEEFELTRIELLREEARAVGGEGNRGVVGHHGLALIAELLKQGIPVPFIIEFLLFGGRIVGGKLMMDGRPVLDNDPTEVDRDRSDEPTAADESDPGTTAWVVEAIGGGEAEGNIVEFGWEVATTIEESGVSGTGKGTASIDSYCTGQLDNGTEGLVQVRAEFVLAVEITGQSNGSLLELDLRITSYGLTSFNATCEGITVYRDSVAFFRSTLPAGAVSIEAVDGATATMTGDSISATVTLRPAVPIP